MTWLGTLLFVMIVAYGAPADAASANDRFSEEEVYFESGNVTLHGTLLVPEEDLSGGHPAIALVHGSGPGPRDQLRREAEAFARKGVVTLIYDKRTEGYSESGMGERSYGLLADDAIAAVRALQGRPEVDAESVGLWGLSEGGWVVPIAANRSEDVAFVVLVGASGVSPARQVSWYLENALRHQGVSGSVVRAVSRTGIRVQAGTGGMAEADHDPVAPLERLRQPVLALWGEKDRVVPPAESARIAQAALRNGGNESYTIRFFPDAQHGLEFSPDGFDRGETLAEGYPETIASWIAAVTRGEAPPSSADAPPRQQRLSRPLEPLSWWESDWAQLGAMAVPLLAFASYPAIALGATAVRLLRGRPRGSSGKLEPSMRRWAWCVVGGGIAALTAFVCYFGFLLATAASSVGPVALERPVPWLVAQLLSVVTCASVVLLGVSWRKTPKRLTVTQRVRLCVLLVGGAVFAVWAAYWDLLAI